MSKLVKAIGRGIKKVFKAVKKVVKKITSSKIFKAVAIAAAIYFTAGAAAGMIGAKGAAATAGAASSGVAATSAAAASSQAAMLGSAVGFPSATLTGAVGAAGSAGTIAAGTAGTLASSGNAISSLLSAGATKAAGLAQWSVATPANAMIASTGMNIAGQVIGAKAAADAEYDRYKAEKAEFDTNTSFKLNVADRLNQTPFGVGNQLSYTPTTTQGKAGGQAAMQTPYANTGYYDPTTDTYRNV